MKLPKEERPPREGLRFLLRAGFALVLIVLLTAGATATAGLLQLKSVITPPSGAPAPLQTNQVTVAQPGRPQTILILGSDRRWDDLKRNNPALLRSNPARSDTILLVRMDPSQQATAVLSLPRDLKVLIPGYGINKINAAYSLGGANLTAKTIKALFGGSFTINHIVDVNFRGFREAVDAVGCVYTDVDRRYYHSNAGLPPGQRWAEINIQPGYQQLCGQRALDYVRFRHTDSDIVRAARQQDFLRSAKDQISTSKLLGDWHKLTKIFQRYTQTDSTLRSVPDVLKVLKLAIYSAGHPVAQIKFPPVYTGDPQTGEYVEASAATLARLKYEFFHASPKVSSSSSSSSTSSSTSSSHGHGHAHAHHTSSHAYAALVARAGLVDATRLGQDLAAPAVAQRSLDFPLYFPTRLTAQGQYTSVQPSPRIYGIRDRAGKPHRAYRLVVVQNELEGQYYGIEGTDWKSPPLLSHPTSSMSVHGRKLLLFKAGSRLRFVAWERKNAVYWVSNSLSLELTNAQMVGIAASLTHLNP